MRQKIGAGALAGCLVVLVAGMAAAADTPDPGEQIKDGAIQVGQGIKQGAINLWEATKSAVSAGADKLSHAGKDSGSPPGKTQPVPQSPPAK